MDHGILKVQKLADKLESYMNNESQLFQAINELDQETITNLMTEYTKVLQNFKPVNLLRYEVLYRRREGETINKEIVEEVKNRIRQKDVQYFNKYGTQFADQLSAYPAKKGDLFRVWKNPFRLFYVYFFSGNLKDEINGILAETAKNLTSDLGLDNYEYHTVSFDGPTNFGQSACWIALFPREKVSHRMSYQFFLRIEASSIEAGLVPGWNIKDEHAVKDTKIVHTLDEAIKKLNEIKGKVIDENKRPSYWKFAPGEDGKYWDEFYKAGIMAVGWDDRALGDLKKYQSSEELATALGLADAQNSNEVWNLENFRDASMGDIVIANKGKSKSLGIGIIQGEYVYDSSRPYYKHTRKVKWIVNELVEYGKSIFRPDTFTPTHKWDDIREMYIKKYPQLDELVKPLSERPMRHLTFDDTLIDKTNLLKAKNLILYGPPGTGKTFHAREFLKQFLNDQLKVEKTAEEYRFDVVRDLTWYQVIALSMYINDKEKRYRVNEIMMLSPLDKYAATKLSKNVRATLWAQLQMHAASESTTVQYASRLRPALFDKTGESEWYITESGADYLEQTQADQIEALRKPLQSASNLNDYSKFITFHQSYSYEEFVEGLRPKLDEGEGEKTVYYEVENGIFKDMCLKAKSDPDNKYVLIIDEINRGNISKIFGELITLLEPDKRFDPKRPFGPDNGLQVDLPYSKETFGVPSNLYVIGTMNTADRSIALIDIALRRRFVFQEIMPNTKMVGDVGVVKVANILDTINKRIEFLYDRDHMIGHSYFLDIESLEALRDVFLWKIVPLLQEYFYGDWEKLCLVLGCNNKANEMDQSTFMIRTKIMKEQDVLGFDHDNYDDKFRYEINPAFIEASGEALKPFFENIVNNREQEQNSAE